MNWSVVSSETVEGNPTVILELKDGPYSRSMWDYSFHALYKVAKFYYIVYGTDFHLCIYQISSTSTIFIISNNTQYAQAHLFSSGTL